MTSSDTATSVPHVGVQVRQRRDVGGQVGAVHRGDGPAAQAPAGDAVVVEHRLAVGGEPHVALDAGGAEAEGQREGLERVLGSVRARARGGRMRRVV